MPKKKPTSAHKYDGLNEEQKRDQVVREGYSEIHYFTCPLCGKSHPMKYKNSILRSDHLDIELGELLQVRYAGGRGSGFYKDPSQSKTLLQVKEDPQYADLIEQIKTKCTKILRVLKSTTTE